jgi:7-keto-8-aminopelargonate synthetase-like enzyme
MVIIRLENIEFLYQLIIMNELKMNLFEIVNNKEIKLHYFPRVRTACGRYLNLENEQRYLNFASCDYLGMANTPEMKSAAVKAIDKYGTNISGPMIFCGYTEYHEELERRYAEMYKSENALMYTTSYQANIGVLPVVAQDVDFIIMDKLCHVSLYDAAKISGKPIRVYQHKNIERLKSILHCYNDKKILLVSDGVFSADGDFCDVQGLCDLKLIHSNLTIYIDDAHGVGALGETGCGLVEECGCLGKVDVIIGTMSKSFGSTGGFCIFKDDALAQKVKYKSSTYNASRSVSPGVAAASCMALELNRKEGGIRRSQLKKLVDYAHKKLESANINKKDSVSAVIPILFKKAEQAAAVNDYLINKNILVSLFVPPYVENNKSRLRITLTSNHTFEDIDYLVENLHEAISETYVD